MSELNRAVLAASVTISLCAVALAAPSAENNPFVSTQLQVDARMARIQQEVDRLRAAGNFAAADDMSRKLGHFHGELGGIEPSLLSGPELDAVGMYTANGDSPVVEIRTTDRPVVLALGAYELVHWSLDLYPGANLQKVIVSGYNGVTMPSGVPAGVPVELSSYEPNAGKYFYFYSKNESSFVEAAKTMYAMTGLPPSTMQGLYQYLGQHFAVGGGTAEWSEERVLSEMQPLYKEATANQLAQDRLAAGAYRFTGLYRNYGASGVASQPRVAQMTPLNAIDGTIQAKGLSYKQIAVDPRGPTYYAISSTLNQPVTFDPVTGQETALPPGGMPIRSTIAFDTLRNRLVVAGTAGDPPAYKFFIYNTSNGIWTQSASSGFFSASPSMLTYSAFADAFFGLESGANGALKLDRFEGATLARTQIELSQFVRCDVSLDPCQLAASGDRLILLVPPTVDLYEPLSAAVAHSYLIDPSNGNVTILGAVPEPGMSFLACVGVMVLARRARSTKARSFVH